MPTEQCLTQFKAYLSFTSGIYTGFMVEVKIHSYSSLIRNPVKAFVLEEDRHT